MMTESRVEILWVENFLNDAELTTRTLKKCNLADGLYVVKDRAEALEFVFESNG